MATSRRKRSVSKRMLRFFVLDTVDEGLNLVRRLQQGEVFQRHVRRRLLLIAPLGLILLLTSIALSAATVIFLGGGGSLRTFAAMLLAPFVLALSLLVQAYVFLSWLELRALAQAYGRAGAPPPGWIAAWLAQRLGWDAWTVPRIPWTFVLVFIVVPLEMLFVVAPWVAVALIALQVIGPVAYVRLDRPVNARRPNRPTRAHRSGR